MKRALIILALLFITTTAHAERGVIGDEDAGRGTIGAVAVTTTSTEDGALINTADWTLASGVEESNGDIQLRVGGATIWNSNSLDGTVLPSVGNWTSTGTETAQIIDSTILEINDNDNVQNRFFSLLPTDWTADLNSASNGVSVNAKMVVAGTGSTLGSVRISIDDGVKKFNFGWLSTLSQGASTAGQLDLNSTTQYDVGKHGNQDVYIAIQNNSGDVWVWNELTNTYDTAMVNQAGDAGTTDRLAMGAVSTGAFGRSFWDYLNYQESFQATPFLSTSPVATMGQITVGCEITNIPITVTVGTGGTVTWDYDIGAGWITGKTFAQLETDLIGTSPATLNLRGNLNSNGTGQAKFRLLASGLCN